MQSQQVEPTKFTLGKGELEELKKRGGGPYKVAFKNHPGWLGYAGEDGKGLALHEPTHLELLDLKLLFPVVKLPDEQLWGV